MRRGAEQAGRDPASVRVWSVLATVGDHIDEELRLKKLVGRLGTYLQGYGDLLVRVNGWDPAVLDAFRADEVVQGVGGALDAIATPDAAAPRRDAAPRRVARRVGDRHRGRVRGTGHRPVRRRRRQRDPPRRDPRRARARRRRLPRGPPGRPLRRPAANPGVTPPSRPAERSAGRVASRSDGSDEPHGSETGAESVRWAFEAGCDLAVARDGDEVDAVERAAVADALDVLARQLDAGVAVGLDRVRPSRRGCRSRGCRRSASAPSRRSRAPSLRRRPDRRTPADRASAGARRARR